MCLHEVKSVRDFNPSDSRKMWVGAYREASGSTKPRGILLPWNFRDGRVSVRATFTFIVFGEEGRGEKRALWHLFRI